MLTKDTIYGKDLGNHNFLHYINFLSQKTRNWNRFGSCSFSIQGLLMHSNWHRKAASNEGTARGHHNCISCKCRSWRDDGVALEIGPALLRLLQHRDSLGLASCHYLSSKCCFGHKKNHPFSGKFPSYCSMSSVEFCQQELCCADWDIPLLLFK